MKAIVISLFFVATSLAACGTSDEPANTSSAPSLAETLAAEQSFSSSTSSLSCTCYRSPGGDPYACEPVVSTCYGGPGGYPYACSVCPGSN